WNYFVPAYQGIILTLIRQRASMSRHNPATFTRETAMEYRRLGNSGLKVSTICLGAMMFGEQTDEAVAGRIVDSAFAAGINFIDTADSYAKGGSERMVGKLIAKNR